MFHISFDMDDTLTATHSYIRDNLTPTTDDNLAAMQECDERGHAYINASKDLQTDIYHQILHPEEFMLKAGIARWVENHFEEFCELIADLKELGHTFSICTHRGWTESGHQKTQTWLLEKCLNLFEQIHCLDSKEVPCKLNYLQGIYGDRFVIVDDNPYHGVDRQKEVKYHGNVLQCVGEHTVPEYVHFTTFTTFPEFKSNLLEKLGVSL
ncbi:hypothetical protein [Vibrio phage phiKT1028]|nr:hypothetical protein [Vibrio phage phiKT1028]